MPEKPEKKDDAEGAAEASPKKDDPSPGARFVRQCPVCGDLVQTSDGAGKTPCMVCRKLPDEEREKLAGVRFPRATKTPEPGASAPPDGTASAPQENVVVAAGALPTALKRR